MLIDVSYFTSGPRHIENASVAEMPSPQSLAVNEVINGYIKAFQTEFLHQMRLISWKKMNLNPDMHFM